MEIFKKLLSQQLIEQLGKKIGKDNTDLNNANNHLDLIDIYRTTPYPTIPKYIFNRSNGTFIKTEHILAHKTNHSKF